jgi:hypothetical protein
MMTTLQQKLLPTVAKSLLDFGFVLLDGSNVRFFVSGNAIEIAKLTIRNTYIRRIHVPVDDPCNFSIGLLFLPEFIPHKH